MIRPPAFLLPRARRPGRQGASPHLHCLLLWGCAKAAGMRVPAGGAPTYAFSLGSSKLESKSNIICSHVKQH